MKSEEQHWIDSVIFLYGITNAAEFLGQVWYESARLTKFKESLNYSVEALLSKFGRHRISVVDARTYGRAPGQRANQLMLGNILYGGEFGRKNLGNVRPDDGYRFRGRGAIQLTGRDAYQQFSDFLGMPEIMEHPDLVAEEPYLAAHAAAWFWMHYKKLDGITDVRELTRRVTGSPNQALAERVALTQEAAKLRAN